jgi:uncharacterized membrane protein (DUF485 family)
MGQSAIGTNRSIGQDRVPEPTASLTRLDLAHQIRQSHHNAIWEEQKHFTWLISIILSAQLIVFVGANLGSSQKIALIIISSVVGVLFAITGFRVQRIEGVYFYNANVTYNEAYSAVFQTTEPSYRRGSANKTLWGLIASIFTNSSGVRDHFQFLFLTFIAVFVATAIYSCIAL